MGDTIVYCPNARTAYAGDEAWDYLRIDQGRRPVFQAGTYREGAREGLPWDCVGITLVFAMANPKVYHMYVEGK